MNEKTSATLAELESADWFCAVGQPIGNDVITVSSWNDAVARCSSDEYKWLLVEAANRYRFCLAEKSKERLRQWNSIVRDLKPHTEQLVMSKCGPVLREHRLPKAFEDVVKWDMLYVCIEAEYADIQHPGFYAAQAFFYAHGHFPCGWEGVFPEGKRVVF